MAEAASAEDEVGRALKRAAALFDAARYHDAHEVLDVAWERATGRDGDFLKGLIQACIALHHFQAGNLDGARKLYSGHRACLAPYLPAYRGVDVAALLAAMQAALLPVVRARAGAEPRFEEAERPHLPFVAAAD